MGLDDEGMIGKILRKVSVLEDIDVTTSEWVLLWAQRIETKTPQKETLDSIQEAKDFDSIGKMHKDGTMGDIDSRSGWKVVINVEWSTP